MFRTLQVFLSLSSLDISFGFLILIAEIDLTGDCSCFSQEGLKLIMKELFDLFLIMFFMLMGGKRLALLLLSDCYFDFVFFAFSNLSKDIVFLTSPSFTGSSSFL